MDDNVFSKVKETLSGALGVEPDEITLDSSLTRDLGAESIDFIDVIFRLEKTFSIKIPAGDLFPSNFMTNPDYVLNGKITSQGLNFLRRKYPTMEFDEFSKDPAINKLADLFTVKMIMQYVQDRIEQKA
ncbi:MAG: acyl carrier protein [Candidatus Omnitrophota bacterium]